MCYLAGCLGIPLKSINIYTRILVAILSLLSAVLWQSFFIDQSLIVEGRPTFDLASLIPVVLVAIASALFVSSYQPAHCAPNALINSSFEDFIDVWGSRCVLLGCSAIVGLFILKPWWFSRLAWEDSVIESLSATLCFLSGAIFLSIFVFRHRTQFYATLDGRLLLTASVISFLIGFEEVSWFQRQLAIETPELFVNNQQSEINLHNFATDFTENLYYAVAFVCFILIPFLSNRTRWFQRLSLTKFVPGLAPFVVIAISCSYNYDMWLGIPTQVAFWMTTFIVMDQARRGDSAKHSFLLWWCIILMSLSQLVYLIRGETFLRLWDITEYKEYLIAVGIFLYTVELLARMRDTTGATQSQP